MVELNEVLERARARASALESTGEAPEVAVDRLRTACLTFFDKVPEPPLYARAGDPPRVAAEALLPEAEELLARGLALGRDPTQLAAMEPLFRALQAHVETLCLTVAGKLEEAEIAWRRAQVQESAAVGVKRLWRRSDEEVPAVFDSSSGSSRYDSKAEAEVRVRLACPQARCHRVGDFSFFPRHASLRFTCPSCGLPFVAFFGELREVEVRVEGQTRKYAFRLRELQGASSRVEMEDDRGEVLLLAPGDLLAFLYLEDKVPQGLINLSSGRLTWLKPVKKPCFVVTAVYGDDAPELFAFRRFRDQALEPHWLGRLAVKGYYLWGPGAARALRNRPLARRQLARVLATVHRQLMRFGFG